MGRGWTGERRNYIKRVEISNILIRKYRSFHFTKCFSMCGHLLSILNRKKCKHLLYSDPNLR